MSSVAEVEMEAGAVKFTGLDKCIVGSAMVWDTSGIREVRLVYGGEKIVKHFVSGGMTEDEAREWVDFNVEGAYVGPNTPIVMWSLA